MKPHVMQLPQPQAAKWICKKEAAHFIAAELSLNTPHTSCGKAV